MDFIRNNKSQHIKISYYKVCRRPSLSLLLAQNVAGREGGGEEGGLPPAAAALSTSYISHSTDYSSRNNNKVIIIIGIASVLIEKGVLNFGIIITSIGFHNDLTTSIPI